MASDSTGIGVAGSSGAERNSASHRLARALVWTTVIVGAGVTAFEVVKTALFPRITLWTSHIATIVFTTLVSLVVVRLASRKHSQLLNNAVTQLNDLLRLEEAEHRCLETKARERTAQLVEVQGRFKGIFESSKGAIAYATLQGKFLDVNNALLGLTGYSKKEVLAMRYQDLEPDEHSERDHAIVKTMLETGEPATFGSEYLRKNGSRVPVELTTFVVLGIDGQPIGLAAIIKDTTERNRAEEALSRSNEQVRLLLDFAVEATQRFDEIRTRFAPFLHPPSP
jgi:PAS domain S-box-containing protein